MMLLLFFALMTAAAVLAVLWPLGRGAARRAGSDVAVYRDQIDEVARDRAGGLIGEAEAEAARVEVSRRLIAAADAAAAQPVATPDAPVRRRAAALGALVIVPVLTAAIYLALGSPQLPGQPLSSRAATPAQDRSLEGLVAQVEAHLARNPEDGRGWEVVAPVYLRLGRVDDAVKARRNVLRLNGASAAREADLGETLMAQANGVVTGEAKAAFERAFALDAKYPKARFFLGVAAHQDGQAAAATAIWREMLNDVPPSSPWHGMVRETLAQAEGTPPPAEAPGPSPEDIAAAQSTPPDQQAAMVRGMVERLAARLKQDGSDVEGWFRLVRAYIVLGDKDRAREAAADARRAIGTDADKLRRLDELARTLGLEG